MNAINMARTGAVASHESALRRLELTKGAPIRAIACHEAAHAVVGLAVGISLESLRLLPKPQAGFVVTFDDYQLAVATAAGPMSDWLWGLYPQGVQLLESVYRGNKDMQIVSSCCARSAGIDLGPVTGECDGWSLHRPTLSNDDHMAMLACAHAIDVVTNKIFCANFAAIGQVARALFAAPAGLTESDVRKAAGGLHTIATADLHEAIDTLARAALSKPDALQHELEQARALISGAA